MSECPAFRPLLPLLAGSDLDPEAERDLEIHLATCAACRQERSEFSQVISLGRGLFPAGHRLPAETRARIALGTRSARGSGFWRERAAWWFGSMSPRPVLSAAALAAVFLALVALPAGLWRYPVGRSETGGEVRIDMRLQDGAVRLAWSDGRKGAYRVSKSADPRGLVRAEVHSVRGNVWVDEDPGSSPIVFYRIE